MSDDLSMYGSTPESIDQFIEQYCQDDEYYAEDFEDCANVEAL